MKTLKIFTLVLALPLVMGFANISKAESNSATVLTESVKDLNSQLVNEIKIKLATPLLKFRNSSFKDDVKVTVSVADNGKLIFTNVRGLNKNLISNVQSQLNELNLWTNKDSKGVTFDYTIKYKNQ
ncbi:MAG TPA: hypothetical protein PLG90_08750 [Ignavibacteria bacterium]|nr:hypothetical protein [Ignavibacteria bacterium]